MKAKLPALLLTLTLSLTACGAAPAASGSQSSPDLSGAHALPQTMEETPPVDLPTLRLTLVDGAGTDTLLLAGETAGEVYTVPADSFPLTLDGEPADASVLEDGMPITLAYTGIEESFPARLSVAAAETYSLGTEKNPGGGFYDLCGLYLQVLSDLADSLRNHIVNLHTTGSATLNVTRAIDSLRADKKKLEAGIVRDADQETEVLTEQLASLEQVLKDSSAEQEIARLEKQMKEAAKMMEYEYAAVLRDQIIELRGNGT